MRNSLIALLSTSMLFACSDAQEAETPAAGTEPETVPAETMVDDSAAQQALATQAMTEMVTTLSGTLVEVLTSSGAPAAVSVCSDQAIGLTESVGTRLGVEIGRTSDKLRNPTNTTPDWAVTTVASMPTEPTFIELEDGHMGALFPIFAGGPCLNCHGDPASIDPAVAASLAESYPTDAATGYGEGDLRGWTWVNVPPQPQQ